jgi:hypothetical protein
MAEFRVRGISDAVGRIARDKARREGRDLAAVIREFLDDYADKGERLYHIVGAHRYDTTDQGTTLLLRDGAVLVRHLPPEG